MFTITEDVKSDNDNIEDDPTPGGQATVEEEKFFLWNIFTRTTSNDDEKTRKAKTQKDDQ